MSEQNWAYAVLLTPIALCALAVLKCGFNELTDSHWDSNHFKARQLEERAQRAQCASRFHEPFFEKRGVQVIGGIVAVLLLIVWLFAMAFGLADIGADGNGIIFILMMGFYVLYTKK